MTAAQARRASTADRHARLAVFSIFALCGVICSLWSTSLPTINSRLHLGETRLGVVLLLTSAGAVVVMPLTGRLCDRLGSRAVLRAASPLSALTLIGPALARGFPVLLGLAFLLGAGIGSLDVAMNAHAIVVERRYGRAIMSAFHGFWSVGGVLGSAVIAVGLHVRASDPALIVGGAIASAVLLVVPGPLLLQRSAPQAPPATGPSTPTPATSTPATGGSLSSASATPASTSATDKPPTPTPATPTPTPAPATPTATPAPATPTATPAPATPTATPAPATPTPATPTPTPTPAPATPTPAPATPTPTPAPATPTHVPAPAGGGRGVVLLLGVVAAAGFICEGAAYNWAPLHAIRELHAAPSTAALTYTVFATMLMTGRLTGDWMRRWLGEVRAMICAGGVAVCGYLLVALAPSLSSTGLACDFAGWAVTALGLATVVPVIFSAVGARDAGVGRALSWVAVCAYGGELAGPAVIGPVAGATSLRTAMLLPGGLAALITVLGPIAIIKARAPAGPAPADHPTGRELAR